MTTFEQLYQSAFCESDQDMALWRLAREYHERTEWFDQAHCRVRNERGIAIPVGQERTVCSRHAMRVKAELSERAHQLRLPGLNDAIRADERRFESDWRAGRRHLATPDPTTESTTLR